MMKYSTITPEVLYTTDRVTWTAAADIAKLKEMAQANPRKRIRLCAHPDTDDALHEMLIVHSSGNYVPPHRHPGKSESFHIIEGTLTVIVFTDDGDVDKVIPMGPSGSDDAFFYRLSASCYHTVIPTSDVVVFHETTNGPFRREDMEFAPWSPGEDAPGEDQEAYIQDLMDRIL